MRRVVYAQSIRFISICLATSIPSSSSQVDTSPDVFPNETRRGIPSTLFVGDVVLHSGTRIDLEFTRIDGTSKTGVNMTSISSWLIRLFGEETESVNWTEESRKEWQYSQRNPYGIEEEASVHVLVCSKR